MSGTAIVTPPISNPDFDAELEVINTPSPDLLSMLTCCAETERSSALSPVACSTAIRCDENELINVIILVYKDCKLNISLTNNRLAQLV